MEACPHQPRRQGGEGRKRFGFAALVVVGDQKGRVGYGHGKAREVPEAIRKATGSRSVEVADPRSAAAKAARCITTLTGPLGRGQVVLRRAPGTGIIAGGPMRAVFETLGVRDVCEVAGSSNPTTWCATFDRR